jgi:hypothetical protein
VSWVEIEHVEVASIYPSPGGGPMPDRLAFATPDTKAAIGKLSAVLEGHGQRLVLSDLFRSFEEQLGAFRRYEKALAAWNTNRTGPKPAKRSPPGGSMHQAGRALDFSLDAALSKSFTLQTMWDLMGPIGWTPIIEEPNPKASEAWHIECRGPFQVLRELIGYTEMTRAAILSIRGTVWRDDAANDIALLQYQLVRLGLVPTSRFNGIFTSTEQDALDRARIKTIGWVLQNDPEILADALATVEPGIVRFGGKEMKL